MSLICRTCSRVNPSEARFCYHDGQALQAGAGEAVAVEEQPFMAPFVFPSGRPCCNFNELVMACEEEWNEAKDLLRDGFFQGFFTGLGRADLAVIAQKAAGSADLDTGLEELLEATPCSVREPARLGVDPMSINLGTVDRSTAQTIVLKISNPGMGLLQGTITCEDSPWLALGEGAGAPSKLFHCRDHQEIPVQVLTHRMRASLKPLKGALVIEANGGTETIEVTAYAPVTPFPEGALAGAQTPREIATKAKAKPKDAAVLFENGKVAAWFQTNGWIYPIQGPSATGLGAVQQFFEALGLSTPPKTWISEQTVQLQGEEGSSLEHIITVGTKENRPVYAHAVSASPWIQIGRIKLEGRTARIPLRVKTVPAQPNEQLQGKVMVSTNGNQRYAVVVKLAVQPRRRASTSKQPKPAVLNMADIVAEPPVRAKQTAPLVPPPPPPKPKPKPKPARPEVVEVIGPQSGSATDPVIGRPASAPPPIPEPPPLPPKPAGRKKHLLLPLLLLLISAGIVLHDFLLSAEDLRNTDFEPHPVIALRVHEGAVGTQRVMAYRSNRFALIMLREPDPKKPDQYKRLTFDPVGRTNNTCLRIDEREILLGEPLRGRWETGRAFSQPVALAGGGSAALIGSQWQFRSAWMESVAHIRVQQDVDIVLNEQTRLFDTCVVKYTITNTDQRSHTVGIRAMLDTYIGANDGVPFTIPGSTELCTDKQMFATADKVPDYIEALEHEDLARPGTVARIQFKLGAKLEAPGKVQLGGWPHKVLRTRLRHPKARAQSTLWDVPFVSMSAVQEWGKKNGEDAQKDSAVVMYWNEKPLKPGESRTVGYAYGLGNVASGEGDGKLLLTVGGKLTRGGELTLTAIVNQPKPNETVTLKLPPGFELIQGGLTKKVPPPAAGARQNSPVTWRIRAGSSDGEHTLQVRTSSGATQRQRIRIQTRGIFD